MSRTRKGLMSTAMDEVDNLISKSYQELYGPRFCNHCKSIQPIRTYKLEKSDFTKTEGFVVTIGFTGSRICDTCLHSVE